MYYYYHYYISGTVVIAATLLISPANGDYYNYLFMIIKGQHWISNAKEFSESETL